MPDSEPFFGQIARLFPDREISDIQVRTGGLICLHTNRGLEKLESLGLQSAEAVRDLAEKIFSQRTLDPWEINDGTISAKLWATLQTHRVLDLSCAEGLLGAKARMRVQIHLSEAGMGITCRCLPGKIPSLDSLGLEPVIAERIRELVLRRSGLGLLTGPTGSGKSTTIAALLDWVRCHAQKHIVTLEDPIEFRYPATMQDPNQPNVVVPAPSLITQQEVGRHTVSYQSGLKEVLRKSPNIILLGEIRDRHTMETCIEAAQTGHFVLSTLHTRGAVKTINRILEFFPKEMQGGILHRLSETLTFVLSQGLLTGFNGRVLVTEYLQNTSEAVAAGIRAYDGAATSLEDALRCKGNLRWEESIKQHYRSGLLPEDVFKANLA
jgi:twitching motility protein PilT